MDSGLGINPPLPGTFWGGVSQNKNPLMVAYFYRKADRRRNEINNETRLNQNNDSKTRNLQKVIGPSGKATLKENGD